MSCDPKKVVAFVSMRSFVVKYKTRGRQDQQKKEGFLVTLGGFPMTSGHSGLLEQDIKNRPLLHLGSHQKI